MGMILTIVWLFFSLPWVLLWMFLMSLMAPQSELPSGSNFTSALTITFGPPIVFGFVLMLIRGLMPQGGKPMSAMPPILSILRVVMWIMFGATGAIQLAATSDACAAVSMSWFGANAFLIVGVPAFIIAISLSSKSDTAGQESAVNIVAFVLWPIQWSWTLLKNAWAKNKTPPAV